MRYAAVEKLEIVQVVEQSSLSVRRTLAQPERSPRELAVAFTDQRGYFVSEWSGYPGR